MGYQAFYRKYRPIAFSDVIGQEHITDILKKQLSDGKIFHAYLFTGTRGTGKTTCAKILAKTVNCLNNINGDPCDECEICKSVNAGELTDITEIDAASNNGVENIRDLRDQVNFAPSAAKYRVYIIDEVHMLSIGAFNALLKTLEEPPAHAIFILATTEVHKLPATILSRCQRFDFKRIESEKICQRIEYICGKENLSITKDAAMLISAAADGGMRDALSILDLCAAKSANIDENVVSSVCGLAGNEYLNELVDYIKRGDTANALTTLDRLYNSSVDMLRLCGELSDYYRNLMVIKTVKTGNAPVVCSNTQLEHYKTIAVDYDLREVLRALSLIQDNTVKMQSGNQRSNMEMLLIKLCSPELCNDISSIERRISMLESYILNGEKKNINHKEQPSKPTPQPLMEQTDDGMADDDIPPLPTEPEENGSMPEIPEDAPESANNGELAEWGKIIKALQKNCPLIAGVLAGSHAYINGDLLLIDCQNDQFLNLIRNNASYREHIKKAAFEVLGKTYRLGPYIKPTAESDDPLAKFADKLKQIEMPKRS